MCVCLCVRVLFHVCVCMLGVCVTCVRVFCVGVSYVGVYVFVYLVKIS